VRTIDWRSDEPISEQLAQWCGLAREPGVLVVVFDGGGAEEELPWSELEPWTRTRSVTVADVRSSLDRGALDVALCSDLLYLRPGVELATGSGEPSAGLVWALGRAGRAALARGLLDPAPLGPADVVRLGLAQAVLDPGQDLPVSGRESLTALTTARDLLRTSPSARSSLEMASFRLLFASGDPGEGARAFLDRRQPDFDA